MQSIVSDLFIFTQLITNKTNALSPGLLKFQCASESPADVNTGSDSLGLGWHLRFCISYKLSGDVHAPGLWTNYKQQGFMPSFLPVD